MYPHTGLTKSSFVSHTLGSADKQPAVYRTIIDDVIESVQQDFEEYGLEAELLKALKQVRRVLN